MVGLSLLIATRIIATADSPGLEDTRRRQPAIIDPRWFPEWPDLRTLLTALLELAREPHDGPFVRRAGSTRGNRVRNDDPDILLPVSGSEMFGPQRRSPDGPLFLL